MVFLGHCILQSNSEAKYIENMDFLNDEEYDTDDRDSIAETENLDLGISKEISKYLFDQAGDLIEEDAEEISLLANKHLLNDSVGLIISEVLYENPLPFKLQQFQLLTLHCIGSLKNVVLISPTGSGKMILAYLSILVLEKVFKVEKGVGLGSQPLSALMEEKVKTSMIPTGLISMKGELKHSSDDGVTTTSRPIEKFKNGEIKCILGHPESWLSATAKDILTSLQSQGRIIFTFVDEFQMNLSNHWGAEFRPYMKTLPGQLRASAVKGAPVLAMSATSTKVEVEELKSILGLRNNTVVLQASPVQSQHMSVKIKRPANIYGSYGLEGGESGELEKPGTVQLLDRICLDDYVKCLRSGEQPKKTIIFFRKEDDIPDIYDELCERLPEFCQNPETIPWVQNHSGIGPVTAESIRKRRDSISLYLTTSVMLLGLDFTDIDIIIMVRPFNSCHYLLQAAGRGGRKMENGLRKKVLFYLLYNNSDISRNVPGLSQDMREFCKSDGCLKEFLNKVFGFMSKSKSKSDWCCSNCLPIRS